MKTEQMTVHEALCELKTLDARIDQKIGSTTFAVANKHSNGNIYGKTIGAFVESADAAYQSVRDMINRRKAIRNALSVSNASTKVVIADTEYTVAEAIEMRKTGIVCYRTLLNTLISELNAAKRKIESESVSVEKKADEYVVGILGSKEKATSVEAAAIRKAYIEANSYDLVSLNGIEKKIDEINELILAFQGEVDSKISISNALTTITIEY